MTVPLESKKGVLTTLFPLLRDHTIGNVPSLLLAAALGGALRVPRRLAADASVRPRGRDRDVRRARDHAQHPARVDEDRARRDDALPRARVDRAAAGNARRAGRDRGRLRLPAQPPRATAARLARGRGGGSAGVGVHVHRQRLWAVHALRRAGRVRRRAARPPARLDHDRAGVPRADLPDPGDARRRRRSTSLWGAVVGALAISGLDSFLTQAEQGIHVLRPQARPAVGLTAGLPGGDHGARADSASIGPDRRAGAAAAAPAPTAAEAGA